MPGFVGCVPACGRPIHWVAMRMRSSTYTSRCALLTSECGTHKTVKARYKTVKTRYKTVTYKTVKAAAEGGVWASQSIPADAPFFFSSWLLSILELSDTKVHEPWVRALLGTAANFCQVVVLKLRTVPGAPYCRANVAHVRQSSIWHI